MTVRLADLSPCFQGVVPSMITTCDRSGEPNVTYLSQVHLVDERHVALSCQFFNKTQRNVQENPFAAVIVNHPVTFEAWQLRLRFERAETGGPLFDAMAARIQVIATHTGRAGVFRLRSADVYEVLAVEPLAGFLGPPAAAGPDAAPAGLPAGPMSELRQLQLVSDRIARSRDLDELLSGALEALDVNLGFSHAMLFLSDGPGSPLYAVASRGYGASGVGAEACPGQGLVGTVAERRRMVRVAGMGSDLRYGRAIRDRVEACGDGAALAPEVPLPGLQDAQAQLALPLLAGDRLVGVLAVESRDPLCFDEWDEAFLGIIGNEIASGIDRMQGHDEEEPPAPAPRRRRTLLYYRNDDCLFVDGEYLVRNVPGKILWKVLGEHRREGRTEFTNRELRLDPGLGLPAVKDNLESRLILLRRRLEEKCPEIRLVPVRRGRFALQLGCELELEEREDGSARRTGSGPG
jgi:adenylate cyclase